MRRRRRAVRRPGSESSTRGKRHAQRPRHDDRRRVGGHPAQPRALTASAAGRRRSPTTASRTPTRRTLTGRLPGPRRAGVPPDARREQVHLDPDGRHRRQRHVPGALGDAHSGARGWTASPFPHAGVYTMFRRQRPPRRVHSLRRRRQGRARAGNTVDAAAGRSAGRRADRTGSRTGTTSGSSGRYDIVSRETTASGQPHSRSSASRHRS